MDSQFTKLLLLLGLLLQTTVPGFGQERRDGVFRETDLSIDVRNASLPNVLKQLQQLSGCNFLYDQNVANKTPAITLKMQRSTLTAILDRICSITSLRYTRIDNTITFAPITVQNPNSQQPESIPLQGQVTDEKGLPLIGATVIEQGSQNGTTTDTEGRFSLKVAPDGRITVNYLGYQEQTFPVGGETRLDITLRENTQALDEVVVVGYGVQKRATMSSAVATVKGKNLQKLPVANVSNTLGGMVSGIITRQTSGAPGADQASVYVRGTEPGLILVDGVETSTWQRVNTNEIESITVLKDASAVAPYGLRGANGVILITTKRGAAGKLSLNYNGEYGWQKPTNTPQFMSSYDGLRLLDKARQMDGMPESTWTDPEILEKYRTGSDPDLYPNTDWIRNYMKTSHTTKHNISLSGGTERIRAFVSLGYYNQGSMMSDKIGFERYNVRSNVDIKATNTTQVGLDLSLIQDERQWHGIDPQNIMTQLYLQPSTQPDVFSNGYPAFQADGNSIHQQVYGGGDNSDQNDIQNMTLNVEQQLPFIKGLSAKFFFSYQRQTKDAKNWRVPVIAYTYDNANRTYVEERQKISTKLNQQYKRWTNYTAQFHLNYKRSFGKHDIGLLYVYERRWGQTRDMSAERDHFDIEIPEFDMGSLDRNNYNNGGSSYKTASDGNVFRVNYSYDNKYLVELAGRYDRHWKYAPGHRSAFFPSASIGWRISEEPFLKEVKAIDQLKLRASYGRSGNPVGNDFEFLAQYYMGGGYIWGGGGQIPTQYPGLYTEIEPNINLTWETVWKTNIGVDLSMWNGLLGLEADWYLDKRSDKIIKQTQTVPAEYGIGLAQANAGREDRWGIDLTLRNRTPIRKDFVLNNTFVFGFTRNKQLEIGEAEGTLLNPRRRQTGLPSGQIWGYKSAGLFRDQADIDAWADQTPLGSLSKPGDIKYVDINGDGKVDEEDQVRIGRSTVPEIMWGYNLNVEFKRFDLSLLIQGTGFSDFYTGSADRGVRYPFTNNKPRADHIYSWTEDNPDPHAKYPRLSSSRRDQNYVCSDFWVINSSYVKLKSLELGYNFSPRITRKLCMENLRIYLNFYNLWTIFSNMDDDFDVENLTYSAYPQQFITSVGINITF